MRHALNVVASFVKLLSGFQVLQHQGSVNRKSRKPSQVGPIINLAAARNNFAQRYLDVVFPAQVLGVAGCDPLAKFAKALFDHGSYIVFDKIARDIRNRYTIGYIPAAGGTTRLRHIKVTASSPDHGRLSIRARSSYLVPEDFLTKK